MKRQLVKLMLAFSVVCLVGCGSVEANTSKEDGVKQEVRQDEVDQDKFNWFRDDNGDATVIVGLVEDAKDDKVIVIPKNCTEIEGSAFLDSKVEEVYFEGEYTGEIEYVFSGLENLKKVVLPEGLKVVGDGAFYGSAVEEVVISSTVEKIAEDAFWDCANLETITFESNDTLLEIGEGAFEDCPSLKEIDIPDSVHTIGEDVFKDCGIEVIYLPAGLKNVGDYAFATTSLKDMYFPESFELENYQVSAFITLGETNAHITKGSWIDINFVDVTEGWPTIVYE